MLKRIGFFSTTSDKLQRTNVCSCIAAIQKATHIMIIKILGFFYPCHYNSSTLKICHYNSPILKLAIFYVFRVSGPL